MTGKHDELVARPADVWADLEAKAKAATPGPWEWDADGGYDSCLAEIGPEIVHVPADRHVQSREQATNDAAFIAAANPATILKLIEAARRSSEGEGVEEAVTRAILFEDSGSDEDWAENLNVGRAAIRAYRQATAPSEPLDVAVWRPIETAPTDGGKIEVRRNDGQVMTLWANPEWRSEAALHYTHWRPFSPEARQPVTPDRGGE